MGNAVPHPVLTDRFAQAFAFASVVHASQTRKGTATPYLSHLMGVASLVLEHGADEDTAIAALLHDAPEDQGGYAMLAIRRPGRAHRPRLHGHVREEEAVVAQAQGGLHRASRAGRRRHLPRLSCRQAAQRAIDPARPAPSWRRGIRTLQRDAGSDGLVLRRPRARIPPPACRRGGRSTCQRTSACNRGNRQPQRVRSIPQWC